MQMARYHPGIGACHFMGPFQDLLTYAEAHGLDCGAVWKGQRRARVQGWSCLMYMRVLSCMCNLENFPEGFKWIETNKQQKMFLRSRDNF